MGDLLTTCHLTQSTATAYATAAARGPFLTYFASNASRSQASQARIKAALFLQGSTLYDVQAAQKRIEPCRHVLVFERAIMDGKVRSPHIPGPSSSLLKFPVLCSWVMIDRL